MKKIFGYLLAGLGLLGLALNSTVGRKAVPFVENIERNYLLIPALVFFVLGIVIMIVMGKDSKKIKQVEKEVPIYQGEGKKRKIVGYKVEE